MEIFIFDIGKLIIRFLISPLFSDMAMKGMSRTLNIIWKPRKSLFSKRKRAITYEQ
jgi:hypothetical protein